MYQALRSARVAGAALAMTLGLATPASAQDTAIASAEGTRPGELTPVVTAEQEQAQNARYLAAQADDLVVAYRVLEVSTAAMLAVTAVFGAFQLYNLPTSFGVGACEGDNNPIFDDYGCRQSLSIIHGGFGIASTLLYTVTGVVGLIAPDEDVEGSPGDVARDVLTWVASIALGATGILGILARYPDVLGIDDPDDQYSFSRHMRVVHFAVAATGAAAFLAHVSIDLF